MGMAYQKGFLRLEGGSMGDTTFSKKQGKYRASEKIVTVSKHKWKFDPEFKVRRELAAEFGRGVKAARLVRLGANQLVRGKDISISNRLNKLMLEVIDMDVSSGLRQGKILDEHVKHALGFNFNKNVSLRSVLSTKVSTNINRATGEVALHIPSFIPSAKVKAPKGTTHFRIVAAGQALNFEGNQIDGSKIISDLIPWTDMATEDLNITFSIPQNSPFPVFVYLGIQFEQVVMNVEYSVGNYKLNPVCIIDIDVKKQ